MDWPGVVIVALFGLVVGSFLNVVVHRLGRPAHERVSLGGRSRCPSCDAVIAWHDNVPLLGWVLLRGRCRRCRAPISWTYPAVEAATAALWALVAWQAEGLPELVTGVAFVSVLVPVSVIDLRLRIIPDQLNFAALYLGLACSLGFGPRPRFLADEWWWVEVLAATAGAATFFLLPNLLTRGRGMGMGDVKLAAVLGAFLGSSGAVAVMAGLLAGMVPSLAVLALRGVKEGRRTALPFGPFLAIGGLVGWFFGPEAIDAWLELSR